MLLKNLCSSYVSTGFFCVSWAHPFCTSVHFKSKLSFKKKKLKSRRVIRVDGWWGSPVKIMTKLHTVIHSYLIFGAVIKVNGRVLAALWRKHRAKKTNPNSFFVCIKFVFVTKIANILSGKRVYKKILVWI